MTDVLRIAVADDEPRMLQFYDMALGQLGHEVVVKAENGRILLEECRNKHPDLVITDIKMPDMDGLEAVTQLRNEQPIPVILVSAFNDSDYVEKAVRSHVLAYLIKPIKKEDLGPAISLVMQRFQEFQALRQEAADLRQALEDRKVIEQAKGILMKRTGLSEPDVQTTPTPLQSEEPENDRSRQDARHQRRKLSPNCKRRATHQVFLSLTVAQHAVFNCRFSCFAGNCYKTPRSSVYNSVSPDPSGSRTRIQSQTRLPAAQSNRQERHMTRQSPRREFIQTTAAMAPGSSSAVPLISATTRTLGQRAAQRRLLRRRR